MGNRVGLILHEDWEDFSPLLYSHYGCNNLAFELQSYLKQYALDHNVNNSGHLYNPEHMLVGFIQSLDKDIHIRVESLNDFQIDNIIEEKEYINCFEGGCWIVNVSKNHFGEVSGDGDNGQILKNDNIVYDDFINEEDEM